MAQEKTRFEIPKPRLSVLLDVIIDHIVEVGSEKIAKVVLSRSQIEYCYICDATSRIPVRYRKVSKRIHHIEHWRRVGLIGYKINYDDMARVMFDGLYCVQCEMKHNINQRVQEACKEKNVKITILNNLNTQWKR